MARSKDAYNLEVHYPEDEGDILYLKKRMGNAYSQFIRNHILALPISGEEKNRLYASAVEHLLEHSK